MKIKKPKHLNSIHLFSLRSIFVFLIIFHIVLTLCLVSKRQTSTSNQRKTTAVVILACDRPKYLEKSVASLLDGAMKTSTIGEIDVIISWDTGCASSEHYNDMISVFSQYRKSGMIQEIWEKPTSEPPHKEWSTIIQHARDDGMRQKSEPSTRRVARHYQYALSRAFDLKGYEYVIVGEDDLEYAVDYLPYMLKVKKIMGVDPSVFCASAWNDNGIHAFAHDPTRLFRTDVFPGLGWATSKDVWDSIKGDFPQDQWDWYMRLDTTTQGRDCIFPEVSRTRNVGLHGGATVGFEFFEKYISTIIFNLVQVDFTFDERRSNWITKKDYTRILQRKNKHVPYYSALSDTGKDVLRHAIYPTHSLSNSILQNQKNTIVLTYNVHEYEEIASYLDIIPNRRSSWEGMTILYLQPGCQFDTLILADVQKSHLLPKIYNPPHKRMVEVVSQVAESCDEACEHHSLKCMVDQFVHINKCSVMRRHFDNCNKGCLGGVSGPEVPSFGAKESNPEFFGQCMISSPTASLCNANHWSTKRLCPCV